MEEVYKSGTFILKVHRIHSDNDTGKVKAIGVSNWSIPYLEHLEKTWQVVPAVNQVRSR
jgi:diketogulonate reductase-like aldo/keto reductase